jgi:hypothetical protein
MEFQTNSEQYSNHFVRQNVILQGDLLTFYTFVSSMKCNRITKVTVLRLWSAKRHKSGLTSPEMDHLNWLFSYFSTVTFARVSKVT